jgi:hypothetical protein
VRVPFSKVYSGQAFDEPTHQLPIQWLVKGIGRLQPGFRSFVTGDKPYCLSPLMATSQHVGKFAFETFAIFDNNTRF